MAVPESTYLPSGTVLQQRYEIAREIGRGGYSIVYLARDRQLGADVALKLLVPPPAAARLARERMRREVQSVRALAHPNVVQLYDFVDDGPWSFIVMEYVPGPDLHVQVREHGTVDAERAAVIGRDIAAALEEAHRRGILHRDVKPQNILLDPSGRARLTDFGSAKLGDQTTLTATGGMVGTPDYAAPEVFAGARGDARADVYGLGLSLYYALVGALPQRSSPHLPPSAVPTGHRPGASRRDVPRWLDEGIARATTADPEERLSGAAALAAALAGRGGAIEQALPPAERCLTCAGPDPLGLGICPRCAGSARDGDTLIFARGTTPAALAGVLGSGARGSEVRDAAEGARPLVLVPAAAAAQVVDRLAERGIHARVVARARAWAAAPIGNYLLAAATLVAGAGAASVLGAALFWPSPALAILLTASAIYTARRPVAGAGTGRRRGAKLPAAMRERVVATLAELPPGVARNLIGRLVRRTASLYMGATPPAAAVLGPLAAMITAACGAALELARLETASAAADGHGRPRGPSGAWLDAQARCDSARDVLVQRLLDADAALGRVQGGLADSAGGELGALTSELEREATIQAAAAREVEQLLARA